MAVPTMMRRKMALGLALHFGYPRDMLKTRNMSSRMNWEDGGLGG